MAAIKVLTRASINWVKSTQVISAAQKLVVPVPKFADGGAPLVYPAGHEKVGQPMVDWEGKPIGERGIVFWNAKDRSWGAAKGDGTAVVIMNGATGEQAASLLADFRMLGAVDAITLIEFSGFLEWARDRGLTDMYPSDTGFIASKMTLVTPGSNVLLHAGGTYGHMKRDDRDIAQAARVDEPFEFRSGEETGGAEQRFLNGGVIISIQGGKYVYGIQPDVFLKTYRLATGAPITDLMEDIVLAELHEAAQE
ncbi:MAG: hypothetical protein HY543_00515 [Deltaproteobacteria bacterium]|nr:hypothetical protein [Deltaproteobacteria bacterium]